ncbi:MAG: hypothetical protein NXI24_02105 [bacterium]|nr:hypothetical protein [bacterium]
MKAIHLLAVTPLLATMLCSTTFAVKKLDEDGLKNPDGIPFRPMTAYTISVYEVDGADPNKLTRVHQQRQVIPDPEAVYSVNYEAGYFSDETFTLTLKADSTIQEFDIKEALKADETLSALAGVAESAGKIAEEERKRKQKADPAVRFGEAVDQFKTTTEELQTFEAVLGGPGAAAEALIDAAFGSLLLAEEAQAALDDLAEDAPGAERTKLTNDLLRAQYAANKAYEKAGLIPPFPVSFP